MTVDLGEAIVWLWTAPATLATVGACVGAQLALVAAGRPGGPLGTGPRRRWLVSIPLLGVFLWVFVGGSLALCIAKVAQEDYSVRNVLGIVGFGLAAATAATLVLSAVVFLIAPRRLLARVGAREPIAQERGMLDEAWDLMGTENRPPVRIVDSGGSECYTVGGMTPTIVISASLLARLSPRERAAILAHEWGHVQSGDALANTVGGTAERLLFFDPMLKLMGPAMRRQSEYAADAFSSVLGLGPDLANALTRISRGDPARTARVGGIVGSERGWRAAHPPLERRLARLARERGAHR